jgi:hypothetical protein
VFVRHTFGRCPRVACGRGAVRCLEEYITHPEVAEIYPTVISMAVSESLRANTDRRLMRNRRNAQSASPRCAFARGKRSLTLSFGAARPTRNVTGSFGFASNPKAERTFRSTRHVARLRAGWNRQNSSCLTNRAEASRPTIEQLALSKRCRKTGNPQQHRRTAHRLGEWGTAPYA